MKVLAFSKKVTLQAAGAAVGMRHSTPPARAVLSFARGPAAIRIILRGQLYPSVARRLGGWRPSAFGSDLARGLRDSVKASCGDHGRSMIVKWRRTHHLSETSRPRPRRRRIVGLGRLLSRLTDRRPKSQLSRLLIWIKPRVPGEMLLRPSYTQGGANG